MALRLQGASKQVPEILLLEAQRIFDSRLGHRGAEHVRLIYGLGERAGEARAAISWEALAQLRSAMERARQPVDDAGLLERVLVPWAIEQIQLALESAVDGDLSFRLDFGDAPRPPAVNETLVRYGLLEEE